MGAELSAVAGNTGERRFQFCYVDVVVLEDCVETGFPLLHAGLCPLRGDADRMDSGVQTQGCSDLAAVEEKCRCLFDGVAAAIELTALRLQLVVMELLEELRDVLDGPLPLVICICTRPDGNCHDHEWSGHGHGSAGRCRARSGSDSRARCSGGCRFDGHERGLCSNGSLASAGDQVAI